MALRRARCQHPDGASARSDHEVRDRRPQIAGAEKNKLPEISESRPLLRSLVGHEKYRRKHPFGTGQLTHLSRREVHRSVIGTETAAPSTSVPAVSRHVRMEQRAQAGALLTDSRSLMGHLGKIDCCQRFGRQPRWHESSIQEGLTPENRDGPNR
jgi:hypothetical protein